MNFFKKILIIFFLLPMANSFAAMVEINQRTTINEKDVLDAGTGSDHQDFGIAAGIEFNKDGTKMFTSFANQACVQADQSKNCAATGQTPTFRAQVINTYNLSLIHI